MVHCTITIKVKVAWWVRPYMQAVALFAAMTGLQSDVEKVTRTAMLGIRPVVTA